MKKIESRYCFEEEWLDGKGHMGTAKVILVIDHEATKFQILPGDNRKEFYFTSSHSQEFNWRMWRAVIKALERAHNFATKELGFTDPSPSTQSTK